jgi:hypothetical protein
MSAHRGEKKNRITACHDLQDELKNDPWFLMKGVRGDESRCYGYDPESKRQTSQRESPNSPRPKQGWQAHSSVKKMLITFLI